MPFKTCPKCGKQVRIIDARCWNCRSPFDSSAGRAVGANEQSGRDAGIENRLVAPTPPKTESKWGSTAAVNDVFPAAMVGDCARLTELLDAGVSANHFSPLFGLKAPLHYAAEKGHTEAVALLLKRGAKPDARDEGAATPLMYAMMAGHSATIKELITHGANVHAKGPAEATPMDFAQLAFSEGKLTDEMLSWLRAREGLCTWCGKPLGLLERIGNRKDHKKCVR